MVDDNVVSYSEQPITIKYKYLDGSTRKYTPDCIVTYKDKMEKYFEVKYQNEIQNNVELQEKLKYLKSYFYDQHSMTFDVFTDEDIGKTYLDNLKFLYKFAFTPNDENIATRINEILNTTTSITVKNLLELFSSDKIEQMKYLPYIWKYISLLYKLYEYYNLYFLWDSFEPDN